MTSYLLFAAAFLLSVGTPGPDVIVVVSRALARKSALACLPLVIGIIVGKLVLLTAALLGLAALATALGALFVGVKIAGAFYLAWLGVKMWRRVPREELDPTPASEPVLRDVALGLAMALGNPVAILFYAALLPNVVDVRTVTLSSGGVLAAIVSLCTVVVYLAYAVLAARVGQLFRSPQGQRRVNRTSGAAMVGAAVLIATR